MDISKPLARLLSKGTLFEPKVVHHFSDGICVREMHAPAGSIILGATHKTNHIIMLLEGKMQIGINGDSRLFEAPCTFEALAGSQKIGFAYTDCVVSNVFPTDSRDVEEIESLFTFKKEEKARLDYAFVMQKHGISFEDANLISFETTTYRPAETQHRVAESLIHGLGFFAGHSISSGEFLGLASEAGIRTQFGRYVNHSDKPNLRFVFEADNTKVFAIKNISEGEEFLVCYDENLNKIKEIV